MSPRLATTSRSAAAPAAEAGLRRHDKDCPAPAFPNLITDVATTDATVTDNQMTGAIEMSWQVGTWSRGGITPIRRTSAPL